MNGYLVLVAGYPVTSDVTDHLDDDAATAVLVWPTEEAAQAWIDARPTKKVRDRCYTMPLREYVP